MESSHEDHIFSTDYIFDINQISSPRFSPDNDKIAFVVTTPDNVINDYRSHIAIFSIADQKIEVIAEGNSPSWSPDGKCIVFKGNNDGKDGLWIYAWEDKSTDFIVPIIESPYFIDHFADYNFEWSPDGQTIAFISSEDEGDDSKYVREFTHLMYKSKGGRSRPFYAGRQTSGIWLVSPETKEPVNLTPGPYHDHSLSWSPDGDQIVFVSNRSPNFDYTHDNKLYIIDISTQKVSPLGENQTTVYTPSWSPDGQFVAWLANTRKVNAKDSPIEDHHLYVKSMADSAEFCLTKPIDRRVDHIQWHSDSRSIFFTCGDMGTTTIYNVNIETRKLSKLTDGKFCITEYAADHYGKNLCFVKSHSTKPDELYLLNSDDSSVKKLTELNAKVNQIHFQQAESLWFKNTEGIEIQGWLTKPVHFNPDKRYPLILIIHGGPHNMFGYEFQERTQILSAQSYAILTINPHGSSGYGQHFSEGNARNWGGIDYKDLMSGLDYALENENWIDPDKLGVTGQSYGGYMTNWIITQTNRFKAAVSDGGISNLISFTGTSVFHLLLEEEFHGKPWDNYPLLWQWSPLRNVKNVSTPTLFLHGEKDNEVPMSQTEEMFTALQKRGVESKFVQYVGEGHGWQPDLKPGNKKDLYDRMIGWFNKYLK